MPMVEDDCEEDRARLTGLGDAVAGKSKARLVEMQKPCPHLKRNGPKTAADSSDFSIATASRGPGADPRPYLRP